MIYHLDLKPTEREIMIYHLDFFVQSISFFDVNFTSLGGRGATKLYFLDSIIPGNHLRIHQNDAQHTTMNTRHTELTNQNLTKMDIFNMCQKIYIYQQPHSNILYFFLSNVSYLNLASLYTLYCSACSNFYGNFPSILITFASFLSSFLNSYLTISYSLLCYILASNVSVFFCSTFYLCASILAS